MEKDPDNAMPREVESTLAVVSENPRKIIDALCGLSCLAGYRLIPEGTREIRDIYYDTEDGALKRERIGFRIRERKGHPSLVALKGPATACRESGVVSRLEVEEAWSEETLRNLLGNLGRRGIAFSSVPTFHRDPQMTLENLGLAVVQDRETRRRVWNAVADDEGKGDPLAEMVIDTVTYRCDGSRLVHREVEVEALSPADDASVLSVGALITALADRFKGELRAWDHGKLPTGKMLCKIAGEGRLAGHVFPSGELGPGAYSLLEAAFVKEA